ncbi:MAG: SRPBCC domain-containing protein [Scytonema sp. RU_4_4]|nr:SRPBCC domain-containing protein [Scytonema sp. RU_4_4]
MKEIYTEIEIQAPRDQVWKILTNFESFSTWNPFIRRINGEVREGSHLEVHIQPPGKNEITFKPTVLKAIPNRELCWLGHFLIPGLFDGEHIFVIESLERNRTRLIQREIFRGLLVPLFANQLDTNTRQGFEEMNRALKVRSEQVK